MTVPLFLAAALCLGLSSGALAADPAQTPSQAEPQATAQPEALKPAVTKPAVTRPAVTKPAAVKATTAKIVGAKSTGAKTAPRQLQDIHIEGEIPVPQVLFITARDQRRFMDFQHRRYLRTSLEVGEQTVFPVKIAVVGNRPAGERKETTP